MTIADHLKTALLDLSATGEDGFEGLIEAVLTEITGMPFRLSAAGSQLGHDGAATYDQDGVRFECKLYTGSIPKSDVTLKIVDLANNNTTRADTWVLCSTSRVSAQLADHIRNTGKRLGIGTCIVDWSGSLPPLAVALALSPNAAARFLPNEARLDLAAIREDVGFSPHAERLRHSLRESTLAIEVARKNNTQWLTEQFSARRSAMRAFGEPLSPRDDSILTVHERENLTNAIKPFLTGDTTTRALLVLGDEGVGKSWSVAQSWLSTDNKPIMVIISPGEFNDADTTDHFFRLLASKLANQTGATGPRDSTSVWYKKIERWCVQPPELRPQLVVVVDGINQRPEHDWARTIDRVDSDLARVGGLLVVTSRTAYYETRVRNRLTLSVATVNVPEWTEDERNAILARHGLSHADSPADPDTMKSLCNPRLLGIAIHLLKDKGVNAVAELSVSHLLLEHIRATERDSPGLQPAVEFKHHLQQHAEEILERLKRGAFDDSHLFVKDFEAVVDGPFFDPVDDDPYRYSLGTTSFVFAVGLAVIDRLGSALRNGHDPVAELEIVLEPIAALDQTADAILSALTIAAFDDSNDQIVTALVTVAADLQNPDHDRKNAFVAFARVRPRPFADAIRRLCLAGGRHANFDWVEGALQTAKKDRHVWSEISRAVHSWLGCYSLAPGSRSRRDAEAKRAAEQKIHEKVELLSTAERSMFDDGTVTVGDLRALSRLTFALMVGKPIAPFARSLVEWCVREMLNPVCVTYDELGFLVRLNRVDWTATRTALLSECEALRKADTSRVGKWALALILDATGHPEDSAEEQRLVRSLCDSKPVSWRRVEDYCASDPCDPSTKATDEVTLTAQEYDAVDVASLSSDSWRNGGDLFFFMVRPAMARFVPELAVRKHREFAEHVLGRRGVPFKLGIFELRQHSALLSRDHAMALVEAGVRGVDNASELKVSQRQLWVYSQQRLLLAFPYLSAREQVDTLLHGASDNDILTSVLESGKPLSESDFEHYLETACRDTDTRSLFLLLAFAKYSGTPVSVRSRRRISRLAASESRLVRMIALGMIARLLDGELVEEVARSDWSASKIGAEEATEASYGSAILVEATRRGRLSVAELMERIAPEMYGWAARKLGATVGMEVARRFDASIRAAVACNVNWTVPDVEIHARRSAETEPPTYSLRERKGTAAEAHVEFEELSKRLTESDEEFERRQRRRQRAFDDFRGNLERAGAKNMVGAFRSGEFEAIVNSNVALAREWCDLFLSLSKESRRIVHNAGVFLAQAIRSQTPKKTVQLLRLFDGDDTPFRVTFGRSGVTLEAMAAWSAAGSGVTNDWCFVRLDRARSDHEIAVEVLASLLNGKEGVLRTFVEQKLGTGNPEGIARAIMVAGFSEQNDFNRNVLDRFQNANGFVGEAQKMAKYAYERDAWARHWFGKISESERGEEFWCHAVLFTKVVDGRFEVWRREFRPPGEAMRLFGRSLSDTVRRRLDRWKQHREKTLFGGKAPPCTFLPVEVVTDWE